MQQIEPNKPCTSEVERYLAKWDSLLDYTSQESALNKLFFELCPNNTLLDDILLKVSTLNDFYGTNIFKTYSVAIHILDMNIDERLRAGDISLVVSVVDCPL